MNPKIYVQLGRLGDVLAFLPVLHSEFKNGQRCALMVAKEFASVMDGITYADKIVYDGFEYEIDKAMAQAWSLSSNVKCVQVAGPAEMVKQHSYQPAGYDFALTDSFVKESWKISGHFALWKTQPPLIFDRRDKEREAALLKTHWPKQGTMRRKVILVSVGGHTSPFAYRDLLFKLLELNFRSRYAIVDLNKVKAERIYDLLALYEKAHCLVASDSAPLHLAQACPNLPVVALTNDTPSLWHGSPWRANHICYIRYKDFAARATEMLEAIEKIGDFGSPRPFHVEQSVIHAWSQYDVSEDNRERHEVAKKTWETTYAENNWIAARIELRSIGKDSRTVLRDERPFPGVKEAVKLACFRANDNDLICLTRADSCLSEGLDLTAPCYARRTLRDDSGDTWHPLADLFCFTKAWWREHERELPDLIMGQDHWWPRVLMELLKKHGATELPMGTIYRARSRPSIQALQRAYATHNETLAKDWLSKHGGMALFPKVSDQVQAIRVNHHALQSYGYNGSIIRYNNRLLMAYRYHAGNTHATQLAMAELNEDLVVIRNSEVSIDGPRQQSSEDPRLFNFQGQLWICWVDADFPSPAPTAVVKYGRLVQVGTDWHIEDIRQPKIERNDGTNIQKNWVPFEYDNLVHVIYASKPEHCVIGVKGETLVGSVSKCPHWSWGEIRGGTSPLPYQGKLLRFFHSSLDFELAPAYRRYFMGAMVMESEPPFGVVAISKSPICIGSEHDDLSDTERQQSFAHKEKVIFPAGAVTYQDGWLVSAGCNDCSCLLIKLTEKDLKLT